MGMDDKKTILIVDDASSVRKAVGVVLKHAGYNIIEAVDGVDALEKLDGQKIHLILSDLNMPNMDGLTFCEKAKQIPRYRFTPMIMLTTESSQELKDKGRAIGLKAWMVKPFKPKTALDVIKKCVM